jgi:UDP-N-acetylglucosamine--N-acetylmuramyl-(pentapeptide) pyrophosphoryl-undecaprenol N-acetylglucosamine transferase
VLHVVGPKAAEAVVPPGPVPYVVVPYLDRMDLGYAAADFALCRAGAMTCAELTAVGLPAAYVPLPHGNGEQRLNAVPIEQAGGGLIVADADLSPEWITGTLVPILQDGELVATMAQAAAASGNRSADADLASLVLRVGRRRPGHRRKR